MNWRTKSVANAGYPAASRGNIKTACFTTQHTPTYSPTFLPFVTTELARLPVLKPKWIWLRSRWPLGNSYRSVPNIWPVPHPVALMRNGCWVTGLMVSISPTQAPSIQFCWGSLTLVRLYLVCPPVPVVMGRIFFKVRNSAQPVELTAPAFFSCCLACWRIFSNLEGFLWETL